MKRFAPWSLLVLSLVLVFAPFALAAASAAKPAARSSDKYPGASAAGAISTVTGIAISPLLGTAAYGAYSWIEAKNDAARAALPWYAQPKFWVPALLIVVICAAKDAFGATVPTGLKKPLDVLETIENKFSGLIAAGAVVPFAIDTFSKMLIGRDGAVTGGTLFAAEGLAAMDLSWLLNVLMVPLGIAVFLVVWLASHAINVLILLSPWGAIDAALKAARTAVLGLVVVTAAINPWLGALLSLAVILIAFLVAGWAFRLTVFGAIFSWEFVTRRCSRFTLAENANRMFAGPALAGVPVRTYGRLVRQPEGGLEFVYRPWLYRAPRVAKLSVENRELAVGEGAIFSDIVDEENRTLFSLPPRYRGHEEAVARAYAMGGGVRPAGLRKAWSALRELIGGRVAKPELLAA